MQNNVLYSFKFRKIFLLIFVTFYLQTLFSNSYAFDTTDTTPPKYEISVIDNGANQYGRVVIKISAKDDKNEIKLSSNMVMTGARLTSTPISGVAPLCGANDQNMTLDIRGTIFTNDFSNPTSLKGNLRTFYIVFGVNLGKLPEGCIEWRLPSQNQLSSWVDPANLELQDAAGNVTPIKLDLRNLIGFNWPTKVINNSLCIGNANWVTFIEANLTSYNEASKNFSTNQKFISIRSNFFGALDRFGISKSLIDNIDQYRDFFENTNFDVNVIKDLAPCNNVTLGANTILMELLNQFEASMKQFLVEQAATDKAAADKAAADKKVTITCIKGKVSKLITGINPKCPVNYKKK